MADAAHRRRDQSTARPEFRRDLGGEPVHEGSIYVNNAGLVIAGAFLPNMFQALDILEHDEKGVERIKDSASASRGVHLLQYLIDGTTDTPEPLLVLNKILCGLSPAMTIEPSIEPTERELETCDQMLRSILAAWTVLSGTSIQGLQETFLQRDGRLDDTSDEWRLTVDRKTVDVLADQIPWSMSVVFHRWMGKPVIVTW